MAPRTIRRRAPGHARMGGIPQPVSEGCNRKVYLKVAKPHRRIIGPRAYTMNVVERFLLPHPEGKGTPPRRTQSVDVLQGYLQMTRRINRNLRQAQALHPNAQSHSPPPPQHRPQANTVAPNEGPAAQLQDTQVDINVDSSEMVLPLNPVRHEEDDAKDLAVHEDAEDPAVDDYDLAENDDAEDLAVDHYLAVTDHAEDLSVDEDVEDLAEDDYLTLDDFAEDPAVNDDAQDIAVDDYLDYLAVTEDTEDLGVIDDAIAPPSPLLSPLVFSDEGYEHGIFSPEIEHCYYDCKLCLSAQASPTDSNVSLDELLDYEPNLFR